MDFRIFFPWGGFGFKILAWDPDVKSYLSWDEAETIQPGRFDYINRRQNAPRIVEMSTVYSSIPIITILFRPEYNLPLTLALLEYVPKIKKKWKRKKTRARCASRRRCQAFESSTLASTLPKDLLDEITSFLLWKLNIKTSSRPMTSCA